MSVEQSRNNPITITVDQNTRVDAVFEKVSCGNAGDPCNLRDGPGTTVYSDCCDGLVCLSDTGLDFWVQGDNAYGTCQSSEKIFGCTDPAATNYREDATDDDGSCEYPEEPTTNTFILTLTTNNPRFGRAFVSNPSTNVDGSDNLAFESTTRLSDNVVAYAWTDTIGTISTVASAEPAEGYRFVGWTRNGSEVGTNTSQEISINANQEVTLTAVFEEIPQERNTFVLRLTSNNTSWGTATIFQVSGVNVRTENTNNITRGIARTWSASAAFDTINATVSASPNTGYRFVRWEIVEFILPNGETLQGNFTNIQETFRLPANTEVEINAVFEEVEDGPETVNVFCDDGNGNCLQYTVEGTADEGDVVLCARVEPGLDPCTEQGPTWISCTQQEPQDGYPPADYREVPDPRNPGGLCWEPRGEVGFTPPLRDLRFTYRRGSSRYPDPFVTTAENPSNSLAYRVKLETNNTLFDVSPNDFVINPRETVNIRIGVKRSTINTFGDGTTDFNLKVTVDEDITR